MRKGFTRDELDGVFNQIGDSVAHSVDVFLLGGGAMAFRNQKNATKDLDLVFKNLEDFRVFVAAISKLGFEEPAKPESAYADMGASAIYQNSDGFRMDLFIRVVCGGISLSEGMVSRSELLANYGNLAVKMVSNEDVVLFKGITSRLDDVNDIAAIIRTSNIDWDIIMQECASQSETKSWYGALFNKLEELEEFHNISSPIRDKLELLYEKTLLKHAYDLRKMKGLNHEDIVKELVKMGYNKEEIEESIR